MSLRPLTAAPSHRRLDRLADPSVVRPNAPSAVLVLHGFTGTPHEMASLAEPLAAAGHSVHVPALPGHGTHPRDLAGVRAEDWLAAAEGHYRALRRRHATVAVVGLSMGAVLARSLFTAVPPPDRAVLLGIPYRLRGPATRLVLPWAGAGRLGRRLAWIKSGGSDIADPAAQRREFAYGWAPLSAPYELQRLVRRMRREAVAAPCPVLMLHGRRDHTARLGGARRIRRELGPAAGLVIAPRSYHVLPRDLERGEVARLVAAFVGGTAVPDLDLAAGWLWEP